MKNFINIILQLTIIICLAFMVYFAYTMLGGPKDTTAAIEHKKNEIEYAKSLNLYLWGNHITKKAISRFESKYGIKLNVHYFENEDELLSSIISSPGQADVCIATGASVKELIAMKLLAEIDQSEISNFNNLDKKFTNQKYDPGNKYSVPYIWGTTGLVINKKHIESPSPDWNVLFDQKYTGHIALIKNPRECISIPLLIRKYNLNTKNITELNEAADLLLSLKKMDVKIMGETDIIKGIQDESIWAAATYSGLIFEQVENNPDIDYILPTEGYSLWIDNMCIPKSSNKKNTAMLFIEHILDPKISSEISSTLFAANPNKAAAKHTDSSILNNKYLYPPSHALDKGESFGYEFSSQETNRIINKTWHYLLSK